MIALTEAKVGDNCWMRRCLVNTAEIESVQSCLVGGHSSGAKIRTRSGGEIRVWESVEQVESLVEIEREGES